MIKKKAKLDWNIIVCNCYGKCMDFHSILSMWLDDCHHQT